MTRTCNKSFAEDFLEAKNVNFMILLPFFATSFFSSQRTGSAVKAESFSVVEPLQKMHWIIASPEASKFYTDCSRLFLLIDPLSEMPDSS